MSAEIPPDRKNFSVGTKERVPAKISVGLLLTVKRQPSRIILVRNKTEGWGLIAGGLDSLEQPQDAVMREVLEEAGFNRDNIAFLGPIVRAADGTRYVDQNPQISVFPRQDKTTIGLVYRAEYCGPVLDLNGWSVNESKVDRVRPFHIKEVAELITRSQIHGEVGVLYRPEYNIHPLMTWLVEKSCGVRSGKVGYVDTILRKLEPHIPGLISTDSLISGWFYKNPTTLVQDPDTQRRRAGYVWGARVDTK